uniref:Ribosome biogenesis protein BOP1 n=1 Tax=Anabas testudineus TaxID=64144 RepID=A0A7N6FJT7_ANATE
MAESGENMRSGGTTEEMKKVRGKTARKRDQDEDEEEREQIFDFNNKPAETQEDDDPSDSEDSVYSGLEDSGSDSDDEEEEKDSDDDEDHNDVPVQRKEKKDEDGGVTEAAAEENKGDEYEHDSSDEEDIRNTVGNIPMEWYKDFPHIGYDLDGKKIYRPIRNKDELDEFLDKMENPDYWRTVNDKQTGSDIILSDEQVELVNRLQRGQFGDVNFNEYQPSVEFFSSNVMMHPVTNRPADKRSFIPSLIEKEKVSKLVHAIKMGWIKPRRVEDDSRGRYYDLWASEDSSILAKHRMHLPAPKIPLPGHQESYNPPPEYLFTEEERALWEQQDPSDRKLPFVPMKFSSLRQVPAFPRFIHERFERCLDLYLCPRQRKMRVNVNPEDLIPKLPKPKDLQPFPTTQSLVYRGHSGLVRSISVSPSGQWLASGRSPVCSGRTLPGTQTRLSACWLSPCKHLDSVVLILSPSLADRQVVLSSERLLLGQQEAEPAEEVGPITWIEAEGEERNQGIHLKIQHPKAVHQVAWHAKGDYLASVMPDHSSHLQVFIHQVSRRRSQNPFRKNKGLVQCVSFHPVRPYFFVATQRSVRIYNLVKQEMTKKLQANSKWISSMAVHPGGDHVICGSYDCRLSWFDLDLSTKPYKMLRHHKKAVRGVAYHRVYPLFASASDDGSVIVCHGTVYNDLLQNPLIVPVKVLRGHVITNDLGVLDLTFHPTQPWVFSSGADATIRLFT